MSYLRCCSVLSLTVISSCFSVYSSGPTAQEVIGARRVRAFLAGFGNPFIVGPTFKNVVEGNARDDYTELNIDYIILIKIRKRN